MIEVNKGVLVIGLSNTVLFGGEETIELLMLDVASGKDFSLPLTGEQAEILLNQITVEELLSIETPQEEPEASIHSTYSDLETTEARGRLDGILNSSVTPPTASGVAVDAFANSEKTPQL